MDGIHRDPTSTNTNHPTSTTCEDASPPANIPPWRRPRADEPDQATALIETQQDAATGLPLPPIQQWQQPTAQPIPAQPTAETTGQTLQPGGEYLSSTPANPDLLQLPHTNAAQYPTPPPGWETCSIQHPTSVIAAVQSTPLVNTTTRGLVNGEEVSKGEGNGKHIKTEDEDADADVEMTEDMVEDLGEETDAEGELEDGEIAGKEVDMKDVEEIVSNKEEPNFIWNEGNHTHWGRCYFEALKQDSAFSSIPVRRPFYRNPDGFILEEHP